MELKHDVQADAVYIYLSDKPYAYGRDLDDERRIDYASNNSPIGVELLCVSRGVNVDSLPYKDEIAEMLEHHGIRVYAMGGYPMDGGVMFNVHLAFSETAGASELTAHLKEKEEVTV